MSSKRVIFCNKAPTPIGPYCQAIESNVSKRLYLSGQLGMDAKTSELVSGGIEAETRQLINNIQFILQEAGYDLTDITVSTVLLADMNDFARFNEIYSQYFDKSPPTRTCFQAAKLPKNARVEVTVIAEK